MNIILIPTHNAYGDCLSTIGMLYYLLNHYDNVYYNIDGNNIADYYKCYFRHDPLFNKRIFIKSTNECVDIINSSSQIDICNTQMSDKKPLIHTSVRYYFSHNKPLYEHLKIEENYIQKPNCTYPNKNIEINHEFYYKMVGLNNNVRMDFFHYQRNIENEILYKNKILKEYGLNENSKYNIINDPITSWKYNTNHKIKNYINNDYPIVNISDSSPCIGYLTKLVEDAESIHLIENNNVNFLYHMQYKNLLKYEKDIYFHVWLRDRNWLWAKDYNFDSAWKMMSNPKLKNWIFLFNESEAQLVV